MKNITYTALKILSAVRNEPKTLSDISAEIDSSRAYVEQITTVLRKDGLVATKRGCKGGLYLKFHPQVIPVLRVAKLFEEAPKDGMERLIGGMLVKCLERLTVADLVVRK